MKSLNYNNDHTFILIILNRVGTLPLFVRETSRSTYFDIGMTAPCIPFGYTGTSKVTDYVAA